MDNFETYLNDHVTNDTIELETNPIIFERLKYHALIKGTENKVTQNSIIPSIATLLSSKFLVWKLSFAIILLISFMGYQQMNNTTNVIYSNDTAQVLYALDTLNIKVLNDSLCN